MNVTIPCLCPPKDGEPRHPEDTVTLRDKLGFRGVTTIRWAVALLKENDADASVADVLAVLTENYVMAGVEAWTIVDDKGKPVEVTPAALRDILLDDPIASQIVADAADDLYLAVMLPLLNRASMSSPPSRKTRSTSAGTGSSRKRPRPSKPSSISTIPTVVTETTSSSLDGDSRSSPNSVTAA
jgi:hypothetical protein